VTKDLYQQQRQLHQTLASKSIEAVDAYRRRYITPPNDAEQRRKIGDFQDALERDIMSLETELKLVTRALHYQELVNSDTIENGEEPVSSTKSWPMTQANGEELKQSATEKLAAIESAPRRRGGRPRKIQTPQPVAAATS
jgi:hypothetical protein